MRARIGGAGTALAAALSLGGAALAPVAPLAAQSAGTVQAGDQGRTHGETKSEESDVQDARLSGHGSVIAAPSFEAWSFGSGVTQRSRIDGTSSVVKSATQLTVPLSARVSISERWQVDLEGAYVEDRVRLARPDSILGSSDYTLRGASDVRVRLTGPVVGDAVLFTASVNLPTGTSDLTAEQARAIAVMAAPALNATVPVPGTGGRATAGLILARPVFGWATALGASYERRASYAPGLVATGLPALDFNPSNVVHLTLGTERIVARQAVALSLTTDLFGTDRLRGASSDGFGGDVRTKLGPVYTGEARVRLAARRFSELTLFGVGRYRSRFTQDGDPMAGSSGWYTDAGVRAMVPLSPRTGVVTSIAGRYQTGLTFDGSLAAAGTTSASVLLGLAHDVGAGYSLQPFIKGELGQIRPDGAPSARLASASAGLALGTRF